MERDDAETDQVMAGCQRPSQTGGDLFIWTYTYQVLN